MIRGLVKLIYSKKTIDYYNNRALLSGNDTNVYKFLFNRLILCMIILIGASFLGDYGYIFAPIIVVVIYISMGVILFDNKIKSRIVTLEENAIYYFEGVSLALKSGKSISESLLVSCENIDGELSDEFFKALEDMKSGKNLKESLNSLAERIPSIKIRSIIQLFIQANKLGSEIITSLDYQVDDMRQFNFILLKEKINRVPVYVFIASLLLFLPVVMLIILAPRIIEFLN